MDNQKAEILNSDWDERVLELLVCPVCRGSLHPEPDTLRISCIACGRKYPLEDGIPVLIVERAASK
ncbi:Trm112 family protein [Acidicapsa dinghuensis]|uniref:Trm112 family protein n=1 Tax=Acidicapsa dinghuensis TaxID=2218256 RepID=A0ABW1EH12_9BACT